MKKLLSFFLAAFILTASAPVMGQNRAAVNQLSDELHYSDISKKLSKIEASLKKDTISSEDLADDVAYLSSTRVQLADTKKNIERELKFVEKRIEALGEEPKDGSKEVPIIAQKRKEFNNELSTEKGRIAEVDILMAKLDELDLAIFNLRNRELLGNLLIRGTPLVYPAELFSSTKLFVGLFWDIVKSPVDWYTGLSKSEHNLVKAKLIPVALIIFFASWLGWYLRMFIMRRFGYRKDIEHPRYGKKVMAALSVAVAYGVIPTLIIGSFLVWMVSTKILTTGFLGVVLNSFLYYSLYVIMGNAVSRVIFAPYNEKWRLVNVDNYKAKRITKALYLSVSLIGLMAFLTHVVKVDNYPIELLTYLTALSSGVKAFCIILITKRTLWDKFEDTDTGSEESTQAPLTSIAEADMTAPAEEEDDAETNAFRLTFFISLLALGSFVLSLVGYPYLSAFILNRFILSVLVIGAFLAVRKTFYEIIHRLLLLRFWVKTFRLRRRIISKIDFWSSLLIDPLFALTALFVILALWGVPTDVLTSMVYRLFTGFTIGGVHISLISIVLGILSFFVVITVIKSLRRRLEDNVLTRMDIDEGIKHSLSSGFSFLGYVIAALLAIAIMGGSLTNFALVAGALSVGIGLGLQNIVNNFVSGIILLFERPIKVGDWVVIAGEEGRVKQINIRSTEIETFKRSSVIIPNASLLSGTVTNLTHSNNWARYTISVGVAYGSDTEKVRTILLECAQSNKRVLKKPEPYVLFQNFGNSSLDFELRFYVSDIWAGWTVPSDLRYEINRRFLEEGIEIPFPQMVVHRGSEVSKETESQFYASRKGLKNASE